MKDFSWKYFCNTGQIDAYLLYKDCEKNQNSTYETESESDEKS